MMLQLPTPRSLIETRNSWTGPSLKWPGPCRLAWWTLRMEFGLKPLVQRAKFATSFSLSVASQTAPIWGNLGKWNGDWAFRYIWYSSWAKGLLGILTRERNRASWLDTAEEPHTVFCNGTARRFWKAWKWTFARMTDRRWWVQKILPTSIPSNPDIY